MKAAAKERAPKATPNKVHRQRVANRNQKERVRVLEAEVAELKERNAELEAYCVDAEMRLESAKDEELDLSCVDAETRRGMW